MNKLSSLTRLGSILLAAAVLLSCGSVPLTGRRQVLLVSDKEVLEAGLTQYDEYMSTATLSTNIKNTAMVKLVGGKLAVATEAYLLKNGLVSDAANLKWEFNLVKNDEVNAFCMPGGKIVVYEGLLNVAKTADELAVVLGHEIGHAVAKHSNERLSQQLMAQYGMAIVQEALSKKSEAVQTVGTSVFGLGAQVGVMLPYSRKHEYEADYMGLVFMEAAGYDCESALDFWTAMSAGGKEMSDLLSTHPSDSKRIAEIRKRIPEAKEVAKNL